MFSPTDLRKDTLISLDGVPYKVVEYAQKQMGRGGSIVNTKLKNLVNGNVLTKTFRNDEKVESASLEHQSVQFLYSTNSTLSVMTPEFETIEVDRNIEQDLPKYIKEGENVEALTFEGKIISFELPVKVDLRVTSAPGADKGNSASATTKEIQLETGLKLQAPQFIKEGDLVKVDTRSGAYLERAK